MVNIRFVGQTFPVSATVVKSKGHTLNKKFKTNKQNIPPFRDQGPTAIPGGGVIKLYDTNLGGDGYYIKKISSDIR